MSRLSRREIERDLESFTPLEDDLHGPGIVLDMTSLPPGATREDSPHPDLTVEAWPHTPGENGLQLAVPNVVPQSYASRSYLVVESCDGCTTDTWPDTDEDEDAAVPACELWEAMTEADLEEEYAHRKANNEPIPERLAHYEEE